MARKDYLFNPFNTVSGRELIPWGELEKSRHEHLANCEEPQGFLRQLLLNFDI